MEVIIFIAGAIVGYFIEKILDFLTLRINVASKRRHWKKSEAVWKKWQSVFKGLEVVQIGWKNHEFTEKQVLITVDDKFKLVDDTKNNIYEKHLDSWQSSGIPNNEQIGVLSLDPHRISDKVGENEHSHLLRINAQSYMYYDFLSTHQILVSGTEEEKKFLGTKIKDPHYLQPLPIFPNPLSVGLSVFCENGDFLVLTRRSKQILSGGNIWGGVIYNAVGENAVYADSDGTHEGMCKISIWKTAIRGLQEEIGLEFEPDQSENLVLHSFVWDTRIYDYKFFGYVFTPMSRSEIYKSWLSAADRHEHWALSFHDTSTRSQCIKLVEEMVNHLSDYGSECVLCTIRSLLHSKKISPMDFDNILKRSSNE